MANEFARGMLTPGQFHQNRDAYERMSEIPETTPDSVGEIIQAETLTWNVSAQQVIGKDIGRQLDDLPSDQRAAQREVMEIRDRVRRRERDIAEPALDQIRK